MRSFQEEQRNEEHGLTSIGTPSHLTQGRRHHEAETSDCRTAFQRDRDRIIGCKAFGRLQHKTQVFLFHEGDFYRTRLTHSLEVAHIARRIAQQLGANRDLAEAISLAHDLGHPPFGHAGERVLKRVMETHGGFEHNHQALRVVDELETSCSEYDGLNLTWETREGMARHTSYFDDPPAHPEFATPQPSIEAQIANAADVIAYATHDLEDAIEARLVDQHDFKAQDFWKHAQQTGDLLDTSCQQGIRLLTKRMREILVQNLVEETSHNIEVHHVNWETARNAPKAIVSFSREVSGKVQGFVKTLYDAVYRDPRVARMDSNGQRTLTMLFNEFCGNSALLPLVTKHRIKDGNRHQVVCDFVAGMTDRHAIELYKSMFDPEGRSLVLSS